VFTLDEAADLRRAGIPGPICLLCPPLPAQAREAARLRVEPSVDSLELAEALDREARSPIHVHVDVDYGLGRWGIAPRGLEKFLDAVGRFPRLRLKGVCTHLDYVPGRNAVEAEEKLSDFRRRCSAAKRRRPGLILHAANTSVLLDFPHWGLDMARLGNLIFGVNPTSREIPLEDPWRLCARIVALREVPKGSSIGYASEYLAPRRMRVATLPVGYSDGLTMEPAERLIRLGAGCRYWGMLRGQPAPLVGRCSISHVLADVSLIPGAAPGDPVALPIRRTAAAARLKRIYW
jgi:alanine racemase